MTVWQAVRRLAVPVAFALAVANAVLFWMLRPAPAAMSAGEAAWRALPEQRRKQMVELLALGNLTNDPTAFQAARRFAALDPESRNRLRKLHGLYAATVATQPSTWWRRFMQADPAMRAIWVERAFQEGDPAILEQVQALYTER